MTRTIFKRCGVAAAAFMLGCAAVFVGSAAGHHARAEATSALPSPGAVCIAQYRDAGQPCWSVPEQGRRMEVTVKGGSSFIPNKYYMRNEDDAVTPTYILARNESKTHAMRAGDTVHIQNGSLEVTAATPSPIAEQPVQVPAAAPEIGDVCTAKAGHLMTKQQCWRLSGDATPRSVAVWARGSGGSHQVVFRIRNDDGLEALHVMSYGQEAAYPLRPGDTMSIDRRTVGIGSLTVLTVQRP